MSQHHIPGIKYTLLYLGYKLDYYKSEIGNKYKFGDIHYYRNCRAVDVDPIKRTIEVDYKVLVSIQKTISSLVEEIAKLQQ